MMRLKMDERAFSVLYHNVKDVNSSDSKFDSIEVACLVDVPA